MDGGSAGTGPGRCVEILDLYIWDSETDLSCCFRWMLSIERRNVIRKGLQRGTGMCLIDGIGAYDGGSMRHTLAALDAAMADALEEV